MSLWSRTNPYRRAPMTPDLQPIINFGNKPLGREPAPLCINLANRRWQEQGLRIFYCGSSGSGKSTLTIVTLEELHSFGGQFIVALDPDGEYRSLGELPGVVVIGTEDDDELKFDYPNRQYVRQVLNVLHEGKSVVVDMSNLEADDDLCEAYNWLARAVFARQQRLRKAGTPTTLLMVVEEAHIVAPQNPVGEFAVASMRTTTTIARRGRKVGLHLALVSQRPCDLSKNVLGQTNIRFIGRLETEHDYKAVKTLLPSSLKHADLLSLDAGEFYLRIGSDFHKLGRCRPRKTTDLGGTPAFVYGQRMILPVSWAEMSVKE